jgi:DNA helicase-2/ATP-dependent DNA helicase PcrA
VVIVAGVDTGAMPVPQGARSAARAEEARLLYVALTRATDRLAVTWAERRNGVKVERSPLLPDVGSAGTTGDVVDGIGPLPAALHDRVQSRRSKTAAVDPVLAALIGWRRRAARAAGVAASFILSDETLQQIVTARPRDEDELAAVPGVGPLAARRFAARILPLLDERDDYSSRSTTTGAWSDGS